MYFLNPQYLFTILHFKFYNDSLLCITEMNHLNNYQDSLILNFIKLIKQTLTSYSENSCRQLENFFNHQDSFKLFQSKFLFCKRLNILLCLKHR